LDLAQVHLERGLAHWADNERLRQALADLLAIHARQLAQMQLYPKAKEFLRKCLKLDAKNPRALRLLEELERVTGRRAKRPAGKREKR